MDSNTLFLIWAIGLIPAFIAAVLILYHDNVFQNNPNYRDMVDYFVMGLVSVVCAVMWPLIAAGGILAGIGFFSVLILDLITGKE